MNEYIPPRDEDFNCLIEGERVCERELEREREKGECENYLVNVLKRERKNTKENLNEYTPPRGRQRET